MTDADDGEDLAVGLEVLPGAGRGAADDELEAEGAGVPGLVGEGALLVLHVEGADEGELHSGVAGQHVPQQVGRDRAADRENSDADHGSGLHAHIRLHLLPPWQRASSHMSSPHLPTLCYWDGRVVRGRGWWRPVTRIGIKAWEGGQLPKVQKKWREKKRYAGT